MALKRFVLTISLALLSGYLNTTIVSTRVLAKYPAAAGPTTVPTAPATGGAQARTWQPGAVYMQVGSSCVGYSLAAWLDSAPYPADNHPSGWQIYLAAQDDDGIAEPHDGTTMQAGIRLLAQLGYISTWQSTHDANKALAFLRADGPIVIDSDFPRDRAVLDSQHDLVWTGKLARHAWLCYGVDQQDRLSCQNSGGTGWNRVEAGRFHMTHDALAHALAGGVAWLMSKALPTSISPQ